MEKLNDGQSPSEYNQLKMNAHFIDYDGWVLNQGFYSKLPKGLIIFSQMQKLCPEWRNEIKEQRDQILENWKFRIKESDKYNKEKISINPK